MRPPASALAFDPALQARGPLLEQTAVYRGNALLLTGPARVGKAALAYAVAAQHNCTGGRGLYAEACGLCPSCHALRAGSHPDLLDVAPRETTASGRAARRKIIPIGAVLSSRDERREFEQHVFEFLEVRPTFHRRTIVVHGAEFLGPEAANALLKLVEEPPHGALFVFLAEDARSVLPTIASRSARLNVPPLGDAAIRAALSQAGHGADLTEFAAGRPGIVQQAPAVTAALERAETFSAALSSGMLAALEAAATLEKDWNEWQAETLRFSWRHQLPAARARLDTALTSLEEALEAYVNPGLSFMVFALEARAALED
ncbi:DNA polymerase III [Deinococcus lacus]|uniref:DNA polymerase III n=1 Tax=Deinococcus lacus TaxID=392561 RepID=A0ABW1YCX4_9DEIO